jgi:hypothetical protein
MQEVDRHIFARLIRSADEIRTGSDDLRQLVSSREGLIVNMG